MPSDPLAEMNMVSVDHVDLWLAQNGWYKVTKS